MVFCFQLFGGVTMGKFIEAMSVRLVNATTGKELPKHKGIVNVADADQIFDVVGIDYKIAQHDEVMETIEKSLVDLGFTNTQNVKEIDDGARIHINIRFPEIKLDVLGTGDYIHMRASVDNSYNSTTGLRLDVGAIKKDDVYLYVGERFSHYYHRHTKGMNLTNLEDSIRKGIETFQTKIKAEFENMASTVVDPLAISGWLNKLMDDKTKKIPVKYLEKIKDIFSTVRASITNVWSLYNLVCEVLGGEELSLDRRKQLCQTMLNGMKAEFKKA